MLFSGAHDMGAFFNPRSTSYRIILELKRKGPMEVKDLSASLGISPTGVHAHLSNLERDGYVAVATVRGGVGRPRFSYALTPAGESLFETRYDEMLFDFLADLSSRQGEEVVDGLFARRAERWLARYAHRTEGKDLPGRAEELARILNENGNLVEIEMREGGIALRQYHCTICKIARQYPGICGYERWMFESLLGASVSRAEWQIEGSPECCHVVSEGGEGEAEGHPTREGSPTIPNGI
ncbi:MAG: winged helix-turn-helix transcriptional regulator [Armatimonadetes bacterium]|nr:winged helix-turn-helix transcriptional regulator [Armatimonadota bacterium]